jgi:hypothetical protein
LLSSIIATVSTRSGSSSTTKMYLPAMYETSY